MTNNCIFEIMKNDCSHVLVINKRVTSKFVLKMSIIVAVTAPPAFKLNLVKPGLEFCANL